MSIYNEMVIGNERRPIKLTTIDFHNVFVSSLGPSPP